MSRDDFHDSALVLVGHGSTLNAQSALPVYQHADELRQRGLFAQVLEAFWKQAPAICAVLRGVYTPRVFIVPLFISEGYFTEEVIPRELGFDTSEKPFARTQTRGNQVLHYCEPAGTHPSMTRVILARAAQIVEQHPFPRKPRPDEIALFIAGHGTGLNENSRKVIERQVELIRPINLYAEVHAVFIEEEPRISDCYHLAETRCIVMVPFFISDGLHSFEDIPILLGEPERIVRQRLAQGKPTWRNPTEKKGKMLWYTSSIGSEPVLSEIILDRVRESSRWSSA
jgi:sirohydrochlorin cobaltochelatase